MHATYWACCIWKTLNHSKDTVSHSPSPSHCQSYSPSRSHSYSHCHSQSEGEIEKIWWSNIFTKNIRKSHTLEFVYKLFCFQKNYTSQQTRSLEPGKATAASRHTSQNPRWQKIADTSLSNLFPFTTFWTHKNSVKPSWGIKNNFALYRQSDSFRLTLTVSHSLS